MSVFNSVITTLYHALTTYHFNKENIVSRNDSKVFWTYIFK